MTDRCSNLPLTVASIVNRESVAFRRENAVVVFIARNHLHNASHTIHQRVSNTLPTILQTSHYIKFVRCWSIFSARCNIHIALMPWCQSVCSSVRLSVTKVHWRIIANLGFKFRSHFTARAPIAVLFAARRLAVLFAGGSSRAMIASARLLCFKISAAQWAHCSTSCRIIIQQIVQHIHNKSGLWNLSIHVKTDILAPPPPAASAAPRRTPRRASTQLWWRDKKNVLLPVYILNPNPNPWPWPMTLTFSPRRAVVMIHTRINTGSQVQRNRRTDEHHRLFYLVH